MKKTLLVLAAALVGMTAFAQTDISTIEYNDASTYSFETSVNAATGAAILVPYANFEAGVRYFDLSSYTGIDINYTLPAEANGTLQFRLIIVDDTPVAPAAPVAQSIVKDVTVTPSTTGTVNFNFVADAAKSKKLWGIKLGFGTSATTAYAVTINSINAVTTNSTPINEVKSTEDPNRLVDVYSVAGTLLRQKIEYTQATKGLVNGLYIVDNKKVFVVNE